MDIYEKKEGGNVTLTIDGCLDVATAQVLHRYFNRVRHGLEELTLDFCLLKYVSSAGLRVIIIMLKWLQSRGKRLMIVNIPDEIRSVFETAGLIKLFVRDEHFIIVQKELTGERALYAFAGIMDEESVPEINGLLAKLEGRGVPEVIFDCAKVPAVLSPVRKVLRGAEEKWQEMGRTLRIENLEGYP